MKSWMTALVTTALALPLGGAGIGLAHRPPPPDERLQLVASANPDAGHRTDSDQQLDTQYSRRRGLVKVSTNANANACDDCRAAADAVHVTYLGRADTAVLANVATAWSSCRDCRSEALSVQVVIVNRPSKVRAANKALALNQSCVGCTTGAAAYQIVVVSPRRQRLSRAERSRLNDWALQQLQQLSQGGTPSPQSRRAATEPLSELSSLVNQAVSGRTLHQAADVETH